MLDPWSRQDIINKGNFFHSVPVEKIKTDHSIIYITTSHPTGSSWICPVYTHLQTGMKRKAATNFLLVNVSASVGTETPTLLLPGWVISK